MDPALQYLRRERAIQALVPLFLASGATSLVYETLWERQLHLVVGTSQVSVITVLTAFMTGLAIGGFLASRYADRVKRPMLAYALLEGCIGLYALIFPVVVHLLEPVYTGFWRAFEPTPGVFATFQFALLGLALLPPTICMGATLPLLARFAATHAGEAGRKVGQLYGANTLGAVLGVALAGFVLLPNLGLQATTWVTAGGNALLCLVAATFGRAAGALPAEPDTDRPPWMPTLALLAALAGFSSLVYEVAWFRLMVLTLGGSAYAFSIMLLAFLLGIGLGGWGGGRLSDRVWSRMGPPGAFRLLAVLQLGVAVLAWAAMFTYNQLPFWFVDLYNLIEPNLGLLWPAKLVLATGVMLPPALFMGATFPALVRAAARTTALGAPVGRLYGWNTLGAIAGASIGGLVFLPGLQLRGSVLFAISVNLVAALVALRGIGLAGRGLPRWWVQLGWALAAVWAIGLLHWKKPPWNPLLMNAGMYKYVSELDPEERNRAGILEFAVTPYDLLYYAEGLSSIVTVAEARESGNIWLANNGKVDASTRVDMPTQVLVAHLPFVFEPQAQDVLVIGLASGITAGSVALHMEPRAIDIVELEPAIVEASHYFDEYNNKPLEDPRVTLLANDGRNHLELQPDGRYDLVVSEPSNPWLTGVSNLFTQEFFELGKRKLHPGGVWSQWVQMYGMDVDDVRILVATFSATYAHVRLFSTIEDADLVLIGSDAPLELTDKAVKRLLDLEPSVELDLRDIDCSLPEDILARYQVDREMLLGFAGQAPINTDDNMLIEYSAPLHLHDDTASENFRVLLESTGARNMVLTGSVEGLAGHIALAKAYARNKDWLRALMVLKIAEEQWPGDPEVQALYDEWQQG